MDVVIKQPPRELQQARGRIATACRSGDTVGEETARRNYKRLRAQVLIQVANELLASIGEAS